MPFLNYKISDFLGTWEISSTLVTAKADLCTMTTNVLRQRNQQKRLTSCSTAQLKPTFLVPDGTRLDAEIMLYCIPGTRRGPVPSASVLGFAGLRTDFSLEACWRYSVALFHTWCRLCICHCNVYISKHKQFSTQCSSILVA